MAGDCKRMSWDMSFSARSSFLMVRASGSPRGGSQQGEALVVAAHPAGRSVGWVEEKKGLFGMCSHLLRQAWRDSPGLTQDTGPVNLVEGVPEVHGQRRRSWWAEWNLIDNLVMEWSMASQPLVSRIPAARRASERAMSSVTVANSVLAVRRLRVSPAAMGRRLPSCFFNAASEVLNVGHLGRSRRRRSTARGPGGSSAWQSHGLGSNAAKES